jgi:hypothetical protein
VTPSRAAGWALALTGRAQVTLADILRRRA